MSARTARLPIAAAFVASLALASAREELGSRAEAKLRELPEPGD